MLTITKPARKTLPVLNSLDDIRIASPCHAEWDDMRPVTDNDGERARFCGDCQKNVYDLSAMTRSDAMALITRHEGRCCVRFYQRQDGTVLTEDCPVGLRAALKRAERRALLAAAGGVGLVAAFVAALFGQANPVACKLEEVKTTIEEVTPPPLEKAPPLMGAMPPPREWKGEPAPPVEYLRPVKGKMVLPPKKPVPKTPKVQPPKMDHRLGGLG